VKRRGFLASLFALPAAVKAAASLPPATIAPPQVPIVEAIETVAVNPPVNLGMGMWCSISYSCTLTEIGEVPPYQFTKK